MNIAGLQELEPFKLLHCRFVLRSLGIRWSAFKGFPLHGMLGSILRSHSPDVYQLLLGTDQAVGRPFVLMPPLDEDTHYPPGREFTIGMTFFGSGARGLLHSMTALEEIGRTGIDKARGKFELVRADAVAGQNLTPFYTQENGVMQWPELTGATAFAAHLSGQPARAVRLNFVTPLRLKVDNRLHGHVPSFSLLLERIIGRLNMLHGLDAKAKLISTEQAEMLLKQAASVELADNRVQWRDAGFQRYSARQKSVMTFGGLLGQAEYRGDLSPFLPCLALAEYTHLGSQTSFGMGKYQLQLV